MPGTLDLINGYEELNAARPAYELADDMYDGDVGEVYASERVKLLLARAGATQIEEFSYAHIPVTTVADRLEIIGVTVVEDEAQEQPKEVTGGGVQPPAADTPPKDAQKPDQAQRPGQAAKAATRGDDAQAAVEGLWTDNQLDAESGGLHLKVSKHGDCYLIVWPRSDDNGDMTGVDMRVNNALTTRVIYDVEDPLKVAYAIKSWTYDEPGEDGKPRQRTRATLYYDDRIERWISKPGAKSKALCDVDNWEPYRGDGEPVTRHDYGRVPVFHFRNDRPYGRPEHRYAFGPQQLLNKLVMALSSGIDFQSFPQRWMLMDPAGDQPMANFLDPIHPEADDDPEGEGNVSHLSGDPSSVWRLWAKSVGQWDAANPDTFLKPFDRMVQAMAELTETPLYRFGSAFAQTPSGAALRQADAPTVNKVEARQAAYDAVWEDAFTFALELLGYQDPEVRVSWKPAEQATDFEAWSVVEAKIRVGVPQRQALIEAGYTDDQVDEMLGGEAAVQAALMRRVETLTAVASALQAVGAAVAMGTVDETQMRGLVAQLLGGGPEPVPAALPASSG